MDGAHTRYRDPMLGGERMMNCGVRLCHELGGKEAAASNYKSTFLSFRKKPFLLARTFRNVR
jgi:hypothetical protein